MIFSLESYQPYFLKLSVFSFNYFMLFFYLAKFDFLFLCGKVIFTLKIIDPKCNK